MSEKIKHDRRKLKRLDLKLLTEVVEDFLKGCPCSGQTPQLLATLKGLVEGDEFEFHSQPTIIRNFITDFVSKHIPEPNIATIASQKRGYVRAKIEFAPENKGRKPTPYQRDY